MGKAKVMITKGNSTLSMTGSYFFNLQNFQCFFNVLFSSKGRIIFGGSYEN